MTALVWLRRDLRVHDHPALAAALAGGEPVIPVFCLDPVLLGGRHASASRTQFLLEALADLAGSLRQRGSDLVIRRGDPARELRALAAEVGARAVHHSADAGPFARGREERVADALGEVGVTAHAHPGLFAADHLGEIVTQAGSPFTVFSPFHRAWMRAPRRAVLDAPRALPAPPDTLRASSLPRLDELGLGGGVEDPLPGGESHARRRADGFLRGRLARYGGEDGHNDLGSDGTSRLSPYLHFGCISPRELEQRVGDAARAREDVAGTNAWLRQLCWRDFYAHVLLHFPANARREHQQRYRGTLHWSRSERLFQAWRDGLTGYPLVDAGMRQLAREGWMHNRARLVTASFLTKDLAIDWRWGERWFMRMLIDGDEANNNGNWQWIASVGVDPQPPFRRMFNPARQQARFDPEGAYVRRHVPELREVPDRYLAEPWTMPEELQRDCGCVIGRDYPEPIVDHALARRQALERYARAGAA